MSSLLEKPFTIEEHFEEYLRKGYGEEPIPDDQRAEIKKAFYAGEWYMLDLVTSTGSMDEERAIKKLADLHDEVQKFFLEETDIEGVAQ